jgi:hypothetical protein
MTTADILTATLRFACWQAALLPVSIALTGEFGVDRFRRAEEQLLAVLAVDVTLEASLAGLFSFLGINSQPAYWIAAAVLLLTALAARSSRDSIAQFVRALPRLEVFRYPRSAGIAAGLFVPLFFLSFRPVEEIDSINYLHYLIEWMANRVTPYTFATNYVAFWELSFLPTWMVTRVDLFFPLLALKAVVLLALAAWIAGRELGLRRGLLLWTVAGAVALRHLWFEASGVPTLKNDALHGVGFVLLFVVVMRAARRKLDGVDGALLAFGCAFAAVKYTGVFAIAVAVAMILYLQRAWLAVGVAAIVTLLTSGHYYVHNALQYGSPFYPFQINLAFIHLPGTADLSATSILYSLRDPRTWRLFFLPEGVISPAGLLFPLTLAATLLAAAWYAVRPPSKPLRYASLLLLAGWFLYFRSVFSASAYPGDLLFLRSSLNTIRYVDGVLALSELFLVSRLVRRPKLAAILVAVNLASRLWLLYPKIPFAVFTPRVVVASAVSTLLLMLALAGLSRRRCALGASAAALLALVVCAPILVERNRVLWTVYWNDLKPALAAARGRGLAHLALPEGGYFAGHVVAAGNPVDTRVRSLLPEELAAIPPDRRPRYVVTLPTPGSPGLQSDPDGYRVIARGQSGNLYEKRN